MAIPVPPDLEEALAQVPSARQRFDALPSAEKDRWISWVGRSRLPGARRRRIGEAVRRLAAPVVGEETAVMQDTAVMQQTAVAAGPPVLPPSELVWWPWAILLLALVAGLVAWQLVDRHHSHRRAASTQPVAPARSVPDLVGQPSAAAAAAVRAVGLRPAQTARISARPRGTVVEEKPVAGTPIRRGATVTLVVSKGPPLAAVPSVTGGTAVAAQKVLQAKGFAPQLTQKPSAKPAGTVLAQRPNAGTKAKLGSRVVLVVARPKPARTTTTTTTTTATTATTAATAATATTPAATNPATTAQTAPQPSSQVAVPQLVGKGLGTGLAQLDQAGLLALVKYQSSQQPLGRVQGQNPASGKQVAPGTRVRLDVAEGPNPGNPTPVPSVTGEDQQTAMGDLQDAGFQVLVIHTRRSGGQPGNVLDQQPAAGTTIASNDFVAIYVPGS